MGQPGEPTIDAMGVWDEDSETVWLPRTHYARRIDAIVWAMQEWAVSLPEVRCRSRWLRYAPREYRDEHGRVYDVEDWWVECDRGVAGAQAVWRLESA